MPERLPQLSSEFREFLVEAKQNGYGSELATKTNLKSGASEIVYEADDWRYTDNYVGGDPYVGYEHVSYKADGVWRPVWGMAYRGRIRDLELDGNTLGELLGTFLAQPDADMPIRGPLKAEDNAHGFRYRLTYAAMSKLENFEANEWIYKTHEKGENLVYTASLLGGLANRVITLEAQSPPWLTAGEK